MASNKRLAAALLLGISIGLLLACLAAFLSPPETLIYSVFSSSQGPETSYLGLFAVFIILSLLFTAIFYKMQAKLETGVAVFTGTAIGAIYYLIAVPLDEYIHNINQIAANPSLEASILILPVFLIPTLASLILLHGKLISKRRSAVLVILFCILAFIALAFVAVIAPNEMHIVS